ncbi:MAG: SurA N-terminal domain-containing protein [Saccharospirillum sp.]
MLESLRKAARGMAGKVIVGVIVVVFVLFGAESIIGIVNSGSPVEVNGEGISDQQVQRMVSLQQQQLIQQFGEQATPELLNAPFVRQSVINSLINQEIQRQATQNLGFAVASEQISRDILRIPAFQTDGRFDEQLYRRVIAQNGYTPTTFRAERADELRLDQLQGGLTLSAFALPGEVERLIDLDRQERQVAYVRINADDFVEQTEVTAEEIEAYYRDNPDAFLAPEQVRVRYVELRQSDLEPEMIVTEAELSTEYDRYASNQRSESFREVSHILFANKDDNQAAAAQAVARLEQGESFEYLAAELSDDPASANMGGYLGELVEDFYAGPFFEAASALQQEGEVTAPVSTEFGVHLIRLESVQDVTPEPLEAVREELEQRIRQRKARDEFVFVENQLADEAFRADEIEQVAEVFDVSVHTSPWFGRQGGEGIAENEAIITAAFSDLVLEDSRISDVVRLSPERLIVLQLDDYEPEQVQPLETVADQIETQLREAQARTLAEERVESLLNDARSQQSLSDAWSEPTFIGRDDGSLPNAVVQYSFTLPRPDTGFSLGQQRQGDDVYAIAVTDVGLGEADPAQRDSLRAFLQSRTGEADYQSFFNSLRANADIRVREGQMPPL